MPWISSLRFTTPDELDSMNNKKKKDSGAPPSFYEKDIERWTSEKFKSALIERQLDKAKMVKAH